MVWRYGYGLFHVAMARIRASHHPDGPTPIGAEQPAILIATAHHVAPPIVVSGAVGASLMAVIRAAQHAPRGGPRAVAAVVKLAGPVLLPRWAGAGPAVQCSCRPGCGADPAAFDAGHQPESEAISRDWNRWCGES